MFLSSLYFALLGKLKIWQTTETYSPQTFFSHSNRTSTSRSDLLKLPIVIPTTELTVGGISPPGPRQDGHVTEVAGGAAVSLLSQ